MQINSINNWLKQDEALRIVSSQQEVTDGNKLIDS